MNSFDLAFKVNSLTTIKGKCVAGVFIIIFISRCHVEIPSEDLSVHRIIFVAYQ